MTPCSIEDCRQSWKQVEQQIYPNILDQMRAAFQLITLPFHMPIDHQECVDHLTIDVLVEN